MKQTTSAMYDSLASHYRDLAVQKSAYLAAVDEFILGHMPEDAKSLLDVGAGDGVRGMALASQKRIPYVVLSDLSLEMVDRCRKLSPAAVWHVAADELPQTEIRFDVITCLWNVLGHLENRKARVAALSGMRRLLADQGSIFFDVNNRYNAASYGWLRVLGRICLDTFRPEEKRGDVTYNWKIGAKSIPAMGHLFTPAEIEAIIKASDLYIENKVAVDYASGRYARQLLKGQLLYQVHG